MQHQDGSRTEAGEKQHARKKRGWTDGYERGYSGGGRQSEVRVSILLQRTRHNMGISYKTITINHHTVASIEIAVEGTTAKWKCSLIDNKVGGLEVGWVD